MEIWSYKKNELNEKKDEKGKDYFFDFFLKKKKKITKFLKVFLKTLPLHNKFAINKKY